MFASLKHCKHEDQRREAMQSSRKNIAWPSLSFLSPDSITYYLTCTTQLLQAYFFTCQGKIITLWQLVSNAVNVRMEFHLCSLCMLRQCSTWVPLEHQTELLHIVYACLCTLFSMTDAVPCTPGRAGPFSQAGEIDSKGRLPAEGQGLPWPMTPASPGCALGRG